jgi:F0F1-type ATP synthase assembly protein I
MSYQVPCPSCGLVHTLQESDLGQKLACAECDVGFTFDEPLKKAKAEAKEKAKIWAWAKGKADAAAQAAQREICRQAEQRRLKSEARAVSMRLEHEARERAAREHEAGASTGNKMDDAFRTFCDVIGCIVVGVVLLVGMGMCAIGLGEDLRDQDTPMIGLLLMIAALLVFILRELVKMRAAQRRSQQPDDEP